MCACGVGWGGGGGGVGGVESPAYMGDQLPWILVSGDILSWEPDIHTAADQTQTGEPSHKASVLIPRLSANPNIVSQLPRLSARCTHT